MHFKSLFFERFESCTGYVLCGLIYIGLLPSFTVLLEILYPARKYCIQLQNTSKKLLWLSVLQASQLELAAQ